MNARLYSQIRDLKYMNARPYIQTRGWPLGSFVCDVFLSFVTFLYSVMDSVRFLIVWLPNLCLLPYFKVYEC